MRRRFFRGLSADDPVYRAKKDFIEKNGLAVFRLHDNWLSSKESDMTAGLAEALGWAERRVRPDDALYEIPAASAEEIVAHIHEKRRWAGTPQVETGTFVLRRTAVPTEERIIWSIAPNHTGSLGWS